MPKFCALFGNGHRIVPKIRAEVGLDQENGEISAYVHLVEYVVEPPPDALARHVEAPDAVSVVLAQDKPFEDIFF